MAVSLKHSYDCSIPNMARAKRNKMERESRRYSEEQGMMTHRLYMELLEQQPTFSSAATQPVEVPPSYPLHSGNGHPSEGWPAMRMPQNQRWNTDQSFVAQSYVVTAPRIHYDLQTSVAITPSALSVADPVAPNGFDDFFSDFATVGLPSSTLNSSDTSEQFDIGFMNNLDSDNISRNSSRNLQGRQSTSEGGSEQNDHGRQNPEHGERCNVPKRQETRNNPKPIACVRCHRQRIQCKPNNVDRYGACQACTRVMYSRTSKLPCLYLKVGDTVLFREGNSPSLAWSQRWNNMTNSITMSNVTEWRSPEIKFIEVSHGFCPDPLSLEVRKFVPEDGDVLERKWVDGKILKTKKVEPYAIEDMASAAQEVRRYIHSNVYPCLTTFLDNRDKVVRDTYMIAYKRSTPPRDEEGMLLYNVLCLWFAIRHTTASEYLCGNETLGMTPERADESYPLFGKIPIPPVMSAQLEFILTLEILRPLRKNVLAQLQRLVDANKPKYWFTIYLSCFILLHSCSLATAWQYRYSRRNGAKDRYTMPKYIQALHDGANTLLAHFHYCNKGNHPFSLKRNIPASIAELNEEQMVFIIKAAEYFEARKEMSRQAKEEGNFHGEMYFVSQLFEEDWKPGPSI